MSHLNSACEVSFLCTHYLDDFYMSNARNSVEIYQGVNNHIGDSSPCMKSPLMG